MCSLLYLAESGHKFVWATIYNLNNISPFDAFDHNCFTCDLVMPGLIAATTLGGVFT